MFDSHKTTSAKKDYDNEDRDSMKRNSSFVTSSKVKTLITGFILILIIKFKEIVPLRLNHSTEKSR